MNTITLTVELTARNLKIIQQLIPQPVGLTAPAVNVPKDVLIPTPAPAPAPAPTEAPAEVSLMDVKAVCLQMSKAGRQAELKNAFAKFGGKKLSDIAPADYAALMKELGNG